MYKKTSICIQYFLLSSKIDTKGESGCGYTALSKETDSVWAVLCGQLGMIGWERVGTSGRQVERCARRENLPQAAQLGQSLETGCCEHSP